MIMIATRIAILGEFECTPKNHMFIGFDLCP